MTRALIVFDTVSGSTAEMAILIRDNLRNISVDIADVSNVHSVDGYDAVIIGSPIRFGGFTGRIKRFVKKNHQALLSKKIILYFSSLYIIKLKEEKQPAVKLYIDPTLKMQTILKKDATPMDKSHSIGSYYEAVIKQTLGIVPAAIAYFNGRLNLQKLNIVLRIFMTMVTLLTTKERVGDFLSPESVRQGAVVFEEILDKG